MRIFQTFVLPDELVIKHRLSFAAANFSRNMISGGSFDKVYSLIPVNVRGELGTVTESGYEVIYSGWRKKGGILAKVAIFAEQWKVFRQIHNGDSVWFYNMNMINGYLFLLLKLLKRSVKLNVIVLDFTPPTQWYHQNSFFLKLINRADGIISLSTSDLFTVRNSALLPGVVPADSVTYPEVSTIKKTFLISGALGDNIAMLPMLLSAFSKMTDMTLHITGKAPDMQLIESYTSRCKNIIYHGMVEYEEYLRILHETPFLLSTRNPSFPENRCNFPSKIIEALLHNRIVISTLHYKQLDGVKYFEATSDSEMFINNLREIVSLPHSELLSYANQGDSIRQRFSCNVWKDCMIKIENNYKKSVMQ